MRIARIAVAVLALGVLAFAQAATPKTSPSGCPLAAADRVAKRPSQPGTAETQLNGKTVRIDYSRPKIADPKTEAKRQIMGKLVPYGEVWRLGANEATALHAETDLDISGTSVPAGNYTLFALVQPEKWTLIVSKKTCEWGVPYPGEQEDFARVPMKLEKLPESTTIDPFTISFDKRSNSEATLSFAWEHTKASVDVKAVSIGVPVIK